MADDYKSTLNLPQTDFPMKANLTQREPEILKFWAEQAIYAKLQEKNKQFPHYILHDGPPYANGHIHIGHALNKILKDFIVKYKSMRGFYAPFVPGWDCHGLPIELQVDKNLGPKKHTVTTLEKRKLCRDYAEEFVAIQRDEFIRLGVFGDWDKPYLTMSHAYEASIVREFCKFVERGDVYKGKKPVHWCPSCVTALAEAEVEYSDKQSPSIFVKFPIDEANIRRFLPSIVGRKVSVLIWTTTPWTLPANLALAFHPDVSYCAVETGGEVLIVAEGRRESLRAALGLDGTVILTVTGRNLEGMRVRHPFLERESIVVLGEFVSLEEGTGIVHIAPGHGEDDYETGLRYGLEIYAPVDRYGRFSFTESTRIEQLQGKFVFDANQDILDMLRQQNALVKEELITHAYPHCWRCKKPVIFRATEQWFISMDRGDLRKKSLSEIEKVVWIPHWGKDRIYGMVKNRPDWCISRQRAWGVPITILRCERCGAFVREPAVCAHIIGLVECEGSDVWFTKSAQELLPPAYVCGTCGHESFSREMDILDVWFDSGVSHAAVVEKDERLVWPADLYLEGSDQHRGWFQSSLLVSVGTRGKAPYRTVLTHGFTVDGQGKKMSKSLGNVISPQEVIKSNGAEILRLWVSAEDYRDDVRISKEILDRLTEAYRKIRNTCRFLLGNLYDFDGGDYSAHLTELDRWAMSRLQGFTEEVLSAYEHFDFHEVFHGIYRFCVVDMSSFYLDVLKDRLYTFRADDPERRAAQWVLEQVLSVMIRLMAPILSFTAEEVWQSVRLSARGRGSEWESESVFLAAMPEPNRAFRDPERERQWEELFHLRSEVNRALEMKRAERFLGNSLEAKVILHLPDKYRALLPRDRAFLPMFFIVSSVELVDAHIEDAYRSTAIEGLEIKIERAPGAKCQRCWNWSTTVGTFADMPDICDRCYKAVAPRR